MTIYDIAREVGVSASTVSRVINHKPGVREETRQKVKAALEKYNYYPDEIARGLVNQSTRFIGILVSDIRISHHAEGAYIIQRHLLSLGYSSIIFSTGSDEESQADCIRRVASQHVVAVVMIGSVFQTDTIERLIKRYLKDLPVVISNGYLSLPNVSGVLADEQDGVENCVQLLYKKGRRRLAFLNDSGTVSNQRKQAGFEAGIRKLFSGEEPLVLAAEKREDTLDFGRRATRELMTAHPEVDGIIYGTDLCAAGGLQMLSELGVRVPEQVAVIGVNDSVYARLCQPPLTSLNNRLTDLSITCADILAKVVQKKESARKYMIFSDIVERKTT